MHSMMMKIWLMSLVNLILWSLIESTKIYPIESDLKPLLETQRRLINELETIIKRRSKTLQFIEKEFKRYTMEHKVIKENKSNYIGTSINTFKLFKRMTTDLVVLHDALEENNTMERDIRLKYPTYEDLVEAVKMISRLQRVYSLNVTELADGLLKATNTAGGKIYTEFFLPMQASDCYEISKVMLKKNGGGKIQKQRLRWLVEAFRLNEKENNTYKINKKHLLRDICEVCDALGDHNMYIEWATKLIALSPKDMLEEELKMFRFKIQSHQQKLTEKQLTLKKKKKKKAPVIGPVKEIENCLKGFERKTYRMLCGGKVGIAPEVSKKLRCWYYTGDHPFTRLAPFRAEQLYIHPNVFLFHNIVSDNEIDTFKRIALLKLEPTTAVNGPEMMTSMVYHISKGAELNKTHSEIISQRISDFTGFATKPRLAVSNYGVGGYYVTHIDGTEFPDRNRVMRNFNLTDADSEKIETLLFFFKSIHRIASVIFYLSDVEQGGATVFPVLGLSVFPEKGAALTWVNNLPHGNLDYATCHGACPLLRGSKWIGAMWMDYEDQTLRNPCTDEIKFRRIEDIPNPVYK